METKSTKLSRPQNYGPPEIQPEEIIFNELEDFLGEGNFGRVFKGRCRGTAVAVKIPIKQNLTAQEIEGFKQEVKLMSKIFHPNVVLFMGACIQPGNIQIVTEKMEIDLENYLSSAAASKSSLFTRLKMAKDAAKGMSWLHGINIVHRDLKPANLLMDKNNTVKVTDFGLSEILKDKKPKKEKVPKGSVLWMAPEVLENKEFDFSADSYSFGIILWQIYQLEEPFQGFDDWDDFYEAVCVNNLRPKIGENCPPSLSTLITQLWSKDPKRPPFSSVVFQLDQISVDVLIPDPLGAAFWKKFYVFPEQELEEVVPWKHFTNSLGTETNTRPEFFEVLYPYLATDGKVSVSSFNNAINWFGSGFLCSKSALDKIKELINKAWFHGMVDQKEANGRLSKEPNGSYLVRLSTTMAEFPFTLSLNIAGQQRHLRIKKDKDLMSGDDVFLVTGHDNAHLSLIELIEEISGPLGMTLPCPKQPADDMYSGKVDDLFGKAVKK